MGALFRASKENKKQVSNTVDDLSLSKGLSAQRRSSVLYFSHVTMHVPVPKGKSVTERYYHDVVLKKLKNI